VVSFFLNPFLYHKLGAVGYGVIALTGTTAGLLGLLDLGLAHAVARFVSRYHSLGDYDKVNCTMKTAVCAYVVAGLLAAATVGIAGVFFMDSLGVPSSVQGDARAVFVLAGVSLAIRFPGNAFDGVLRGLQRFVPSNMAQVADRATYAMLSVAALSLMGLGLVAIGFCMVAGSITAACIRWISLWRAYHGISMGLGRASWSAFREMVGFGTMAFLTQVSSFIEQTVFRLIISALLSSTLLGAFNLIMVVVSVIPQLTIGATSVAMPLASRFEALSDHARLRRLLIDGSRLVFLIIVPPTVWIIAMADVITITWVGPELVAWSDLLRIMTFLAACDFCCGSGNMVLLGAGRAKLLGSTYLVSSFVAVLTLVLLLQLTQSGLYAVAIAAGVGIAIRRPIVFVRMCHSVGVPVRLYLRQVLAPAVLCALVSAGVLFVVRRFGPEGGWWFLIGSIAVVLVTHGLSSWILVIREEERKMVLVNVLQFFRRHA